VSLLAVAWPILQSAAIVDVFTEDIHKSRGLWKCIKGVEKGNIHRALVLDKKVTGHWTDFRML
jgi:hypothetical protein